MEPNPGDKKEGATYNAKGLAFYGSNAKEKKTWSHLHIEKKITTLESHMMQQALSVAILCRISFTHGFSGQKRINSG